jgi:hypothetical protein
MDINSLFQTLNLIFITKLFFLILLGLFIIFIFMLITKIRSFDKIIILEGQAGGGFLRALLYIYFGTLLFLFVIALVIV